MPSRSDRLSFRAFWRGMTGADAYETYVAHLLDKHPDQRVPTRAEFWRDKFDEQDRNPKTRCC